MEDNRFATELLHEVKTNGKRWFIIAIIELILILILSGMFLWYISLPVEDTTITQESDDESYNQIIGGDYNGSKTDSTSSEENNQK